MIRLPWTLAPNSGKTLISSRTWRYVAISSLGNERRKMGIMNQPVLNQPAAWYPQADGQQRYWDGEQWTEHFAPGGPPTAPPVAADRPARPWFKKKRFIVPIAGVVIIVIASSAGGGSGTTPAPTPVAGAAATAPAAAPAPAPAPAAKPATQAGDYDGTYGTFAPIVKTGRGAMTITLPKGVKAALVTATHQGSANFQISGLDASNQPTVDGLVNAIGNYSGTTAYGLVDLGTPPVKLEVVADGRWTIKIAPISTAAVLPASATGKGDTVFRYEGGAIDMAITHRGTSNFTVQEYGGDLSSGVNEIGNYSGTVPFVAGPTVLVIGADGTWTLQSQG
jgi:Protein of unknown function (DUF2510)